jgi:hypothetical protein
VVALLASFPLLTTWPATVALTVVTVAVVAVAVSERWMAGPVRHSLPP